MIGAWISMKLKGSEGLIKDYKSITGTVDYLKKEIPKLNGFRIVGDPKGGVICFTMLEKGLVFQMDEQLKKRGWGIPMTSKPLGFRLTVTLNNFETLKSSLISDLSDIFEQISSNPEKKEIKSMNSQLYGTLIQIPNDDLVNFLVGKFYIEQNKM